MTDDVSINKTSIIRRCLKRIEDEFKSDPQRLEDFTTQDSIVLNLLRACEAAIDLAMHHVAERRLGIPQTSRDAFTLLEDAKSISPDTARSMRNMVGFRNIAVHSYQSLQLPILQSILASRLIDFETFIAELDSQK
jgi:uncharacterized protein YutE (UPF0331/DUF86 family)